MYENFPNPFNPTTLIRYDIPANSFVKLVVYDITGKEVTTLVNETMPAGKYEAVWSGIEFSSSVYFARLDAGSYKHIIKMLMIK
ncbi:MAG TPA: T9SS type A sorting domain-containing protein [Ignavibacteria bacterium]